ncbi:MAG: exopolysaccharide biosynthesis polyprenyl glycosylphosphotransferase [Gemmatimonadaceae bacterium]|nr:exopolysaccharide biosynthesis polyprenyl glycosylphosphotransferase [Gemmatimonadaceae bacterium]
MTTPPVSGMHFTRLELRHRALQLQRRRFWREVSYGGIIVAADVLVLAAIFTMFASLPDAVWTEWLGLQGGGFIRGLIPVNGPALARRVTSLLFVLIATNSYSHTERQRHPWRIFVALLIGLTLPRWTELLGGDFLPAVAALGGVIGSIWAGLTLQRRLTHEALRPIDPRQLDVSRTLVVGPALDIARVRQDAAESGGRTAAVPATFVLGPHWPHETPEGMRELYERLADADADSVILVGALSDAALQAVMIAASTTGCRVYATRREAFHELDEPSFVLRRAEPLALLSRPALVGSQLVAKRALDMIGATVGLVLGLPLFALIALAIKLTSRGPVFFRQVRVGLGGDPFVMLKFRTMVHDAEARQAALAAENVHDGRRIFKLPSDPRVTSVGQFLRKSSLDELPQLWNVLRGEMSLVGPRPALPAEVLHYESHHFVRFEVLPGITGPWQVGGRNAIKDFEDVVRLEARYIRGWTVWRDLEILVRTIPAVVSMKGAF